MLALPEDTLLPAWTARSTSVGPQHEVIVAAILTPVLVSILPSSVAARERRPGS